MHVFYLLGGAHTAAGDPALLPAMETLLRVRAGWPGWCVSCRVSRAPRACVPWQRAALHRGHRRSLRGQPAGVTQPRAVWPPSLAAARAHAPHVTPASGRHVNSPHPLIAHTHYTSGTRSCGASGPRAAAAAMGALSLIVGATACVPGMLAVTLRGRVPLAVTGVLVHAALSGWLVAAAASDRLAGRTTWLLQKQADGHISLGSLLLFWPYHLGLQAKLFVQRRRSAEPLYNQLAGTQLSIGGWPEQAEWLPPGEPAVLDVTCELPRTHTNPYLCLPTWDTQAPTTAQIQQGVDWAQQQLAGGQSVYVHCAHGHGRSATVLAALLIASGQASSAEQAVALMRAARPRVRLNKPQAAALRAWIAATSSGTCQPAAGATANVTLAAGADHSKAT